VYRQVRARPTVDTGRPELSLLWIQAGQSFAYCGYRQARAKPSVKRNKFLEKW
jgi:hypothetical protein